jgi:hypothetical protein
MTGLPVEIKGHGLINKEYTINKIKEETHRQLEKERKKHLMY